MRRLPTLEVVNAVPHDVTLERATYPAERNNDVVDAEKIVRVTENKRLLMREPMVFIGEGERPDRILEVPTYEVTYGPEVVHAAALGRYMARVAANRIVVVSRPAGRSMRQLGLNTLFAHPAVIRRDFNNNGTITGAQRLAMPRRTTPATRERCLPRETPMQNQKRLLVSAHPETLFFQSKAGEVAVPKLSRHVDINYQYNLAAHTSSGDGIYESKPTGLQDFKEAMSVMPDALLLVHPEVILEGLRTGDVTPRQASYMRFPFGIARRQDGQQGSAFTSLGCYSEATLRYVLDQVQI